MPAPLYCIFIICAIGFPLVACLFYIKSGGTFQSLINHLNVSRNDRLRSAVDPLAFSFLLGFMGCGIVWLAAVLLWGLDAGLTLTGIAVVFGVCGLFGLVPGPGYVGAGAAARTSDEAASSAAILAPMLAWLVITGILMQFSTFNGFAPWPGEIGQQEADAPTQPKP
jgi:hypothetical protein